MKHRVLGGTKVGNGGWGLAWVDTVMEPPEPDAAEKSPDALHRKKIWDEVEKSGEVPVELS